MEKPIIGLIPLYDDEKKSYWMLPGYMNIIEKAGAIPIVLPMSQNKDILKQLVERLDGFLFTGGHDISPEFYHQEALLECGKICKQRDEMEKLLFQLSFQLDKPMLGICRGIQLFNVLLGGNLYQDLPTQTKSQVTHHQLPPYDQAVHENYIVKDTPLYALLQKEKIKVNSYHHQAIKDLSCQLKAMAYSEDGLIEAIFHPDKRYLRAIQWHPEYMETDGNSLKIIQDFVQNCKK
ncbi:MAG: gamma-glutamyl-gamma-aminobutyrate hydrolase family protein [Faecalibacillus sp.]